MNLKSHIQVINALQESTESIKDTVNSLPEGTLKGCLLSQVEAIEITADMYAEQTVSLYDNILDFAVGAAG